MLGYDSDLGLANTSNFLLFTTGNYSTGQVIVSFGQCWTVIVRVRKFGTVIVGVGHPWTVIAGVGQVPDSHIELVTVPDSAIKYGRYSMALYSSIMISDMTVTNYGKFQRLLMNVDIQVIYFKILVYCHTVTVTPRDVTEMPFPESKFQSMCRYIP